MISADCILYKSLPINPLPIAPKRASNKSLNPWKSRSKINSPIDLVMSWALLDNLIFSRFLSTFSLVFLAAAAPSVVTGAASACRNSPSVTNIKSCKADVCSSLILNAERKVFTNRSNKFLK